MLDGTAEQQAVFEFLTSGGLRGHGTAPHLAIFQYVFVGGGALLRGTAPWTQGGRRATLILGSVSSHPGGLWESSAMGLTDRLPSPAPENDREPRPVRETAPSGPLWEDRTTRVPPPRPGRDYYKE